MTSLIHASSGAEALVEFCSPDFTSQAPGNFLILHLGVLPHSAMDSAGWAMLRTTPPSFKHAFFGIEADFLPNEDVLQSAIANQAEKQISVVQFEDSGATYSGIVLTPDYHSKRKFKAKMQSHMQALHALYLAHRISGPFEVFCKFDLTKFPTRSSLMSVANEFSAVADLTDAAIVTRFASEPFFS